jgi:hypothetical protein
MSLDLYQNSNIIKKQRGMSRASRWKNDIKDFLKLNQFPVTLESDNVRLELHIYDPSGDNLLTSTIVSNFSIEGGELFIDYIAELAKLNIQRGQFKVVVNVFQTIIGNAATPILTIKEISPDRRELQVVVRPDIEGLLPSQRAAIIDLYIDSYASAYDADLALNFGGNRLYKILSHKEWYDRDDVVFRLYEPLPDEVNLNDTCWIIEELSDPYIDTININLDPIPVEPNYLRGPNFEIDIDYNLVTETGFKTWSTLLDANVNTQQKLIDRYFSGSLGGIELGIDYTGFDNFVHYSSAYERLANFKYKLELIEYYDNQIEVINNASASAGYASQNNIAKFTERKDNVVGEFDSFEKWLYNEPTSSLTTHGASGSYIGANGYCLKPYPKYLTNSGYVLHDVTSSIAQTWYNGFSATASLYDEQNNNALLNTIPEHIRLDDNNSSYETFVNMIGHHFDILYTYIDALTRVHHFEEQPKLSIDRSILPDIAKSLGWELANGKQATQLWQYKLGTNTVGAFAQSGSIFSESDQTITEEVWGRIVNNLPYLLKTKGTSRSIKALLNIYGIPQTLLSIREYGGPKVGGDVPAIIEDRFSYAIDFNRDAHLKMPAGYFTSSLPPAWGINPDRGIIPSITREFRFRPYSSSAMYLATQVQSNNDNVRASIAIQPTASFSGSSNYGRVCLSIGEAGTTKAVVTPYVPLYNGQYWNLRWYYTEGSSSCYNTGSNTDTTYHIEVACASDFIRGSVNFTASAQLIPDTGDHYKAWAGNRSSNDTTTDFYLGGTASLSDGYNTIAASNTAMGITLTSTGSNMFSGSMQEYRDWLELLDIETFNRHTLNPTSYVSAITPSSSFDTLVRQYTLGSNVVGDDLSTVGTIISSSQPNQRMNNNQSFALSASALGFSSPYNEARGNFVPVEETYYIEGVSSGANSAKSQKIRFDDNTLIRDLSPETNSERSKYDFASNDSNKLGLFYSYADQVNRDMFNQIGDVELDDYIGAPEDQFETDYPELKQFSQDYWKKYINKTDINSYIRIFSQFDFAIFHQIKQLLAERIDEATGVLIEPHAIERAKARPNKRPSVEQPMYNILYSDMFPTASGEIKDHEGIIERPITLENSSYENNYCVDISSSTSLTDSTIQVEYLMELTSPYISQSLTEQDTKIITASRGESTILEVVYHFSGSNKNDSLLRRNGLHAVSKSLGMYYSRSLKAGEYFEDRTRKELAVKYIGTRLVGPGINEPSSVKALNNKPIIEVYETNPNQVIYTKQPEPAPKSNVLLPGNIMIR